MNAHELLAAVYSMIKSQPGMSLAALCEAFPGHDVTGALRMHGSCRNIKRVFDRFNGINGYWTWDTAPDVCKAEKQARLTDEDRLRFPSLYA